MASNLVISDSFGYLLNDKYYIFNVTAGKEN